MKIVYAWAKYGTWHVGELPYGPQPIIFGTPDLITVHERDGIYIQYGPTDRRPDVTPWILSTNDPTLTLLEETPG